MCGSFKTAFTWTVSGSNLTIFANIVVIINPEQAYTRGRLRSPIGDRYLEC